MKKMIVRSFVLAFLIGILFVWGETMLRIFLSPDPAGGDLPLYAEIKKYSFCTLMGYSSIWMHIIAITFSIVLGAINHKNNKNVINKLPYWATVLVGFIVIIITEFTYGMILNLWLELNVWDYRMFRLNFMGQIALVPSIMWLVLTPVIFFVDDLIRHYICDEPRPHKFITYYTDIFKKCLTFGQRNGL